MCGICGIIHDDPVRSVDASILAAMNRTMVHRGPDDDGTYVKGAVGLAMRRLSIIDLSHGHQPLGNEDGTVLVVCNGEIYNYDELREELETDGHSFKTHSDVEVVPHLYEEMGVDFVDKLNGMFGLALWDAKRRRLVLARDRMGKKPLYYASRKGALLFASEIKALLAHPALERRIDKTSLSKYLAYEYVPAPRSIFQDIFKLEAGHALIWEKGNIAIKKYWDIPKMEFQDIGIDEAASTLKDLLLHAVKRRLMSDVPLGVFLSGGIDSSTITAMMTRLMPPKQVKSFSIAFEEKTFDESSYARQVAEFLGTDHHEQMCTPQDLISLIPEIQSFLDEPLGDNSIVPTYALSKFTRRHVTVALGGDGGDELFAGYPTFQAEKYAHVYRMIPGFIRRGVVEPLTKKLRVSDENISFDFKAKQFVKGAGIEDLTRHLVWMGSFAPEEQNRLMVGGAVDDIFDDVERHAQRAAALSPGNRLLYIYKKLYLNEDILVKVDRASMGTSLEVRAPFLDRHVVEFVSRLPYKMKLHGFTMKYLLKKAVGDMLPKGIAVRAKKGFGVPMAKWLKGPLKEMMQDLLNADRIGREGFFNSGEIQRLMDDHLSGRVDNRMKLWTLMAFELWYERWGT